MTRILNRFTRNVITEGEMNLRELVLHYVKTARTAESGADLSGANLSGAKLSGAKISKTAVFTGLYAYIVMPVIADDGTEYIRMGCYFREVSEWESDFWNNPSEFPNNGDIPSKLRWMAYQYALQWLELNRGRS